MSALLNGEQPIIYGDGEQSRDFHLTYRTSSKRICAPLNQLEAVGKVINIANGRQVTLNRTA